MMKNIVAHQPASPGFMGYLGRLAASRSWRVQDSG
jgi:hypothetical protein